MVVKLATTAAFPRALADSVRLAVESNCASIFGQKPKTTVDAGPPPAGPCVVAMMSLLADPLWAFALIVPSTVAPALAEKFTGMPVRFGDPDIGEVFAELANVMAGAMVANLERRNVKAKMSLPSVSTVTDAKVAWPGVQMTSRQSYGLKQGTFWVELIVADKEVSLLRMPGA